MCPKTKRAIDLHLLRLAIRKWSLITAGKKGNKGAGDCAPCRVYQHTPHTYNAYRFREIADCKTCPIDEESGNACTATPYRNVMTRRPSRESAKAELDYLINLYKQIKATFIVPPQWNKETLYEIVAIHPRDAFSHGTGTTGKSVIGLQGHIIRLLPKWINLEPGFIGPKMKVSGYPLFNFYAIKVKPVRKEHRS